MRVTLQQRLTATTDQVHAALVEPAYYETLKRLPKLGGPEVLDRTEDGDTVVLRVRYRFVGDLNPAVTAVVDPARLTWIDESRHDLVAHTVSFVLHPDHYASKLHCRGRYSLADGPNGGCLRRADVEVRVPIPLVGGKVEKALASGLQEHLDAEAALVDEWALNGPPREVNP